VATPRQLSLHPPAALIDDAQMVTVELHESTPEPVALVREAEDCEVEGSTVAAGRRRKGKRAEYRCAGCGYGIIVYGQPPSCPMCHQPRWEHVEWRPFSQLLDFP
jgi:rubrerythrin